MPRHAQIGTPVYSRNLAAVVDAVTVIVAGLHRHGTAVPNLDRPASHRRAASSSAQHLIIISQLIIT
jgi:hypothetical protein